MMTMSKTEIVVTLFGLGNMTVDIERPADCDGTVYDDLADCRRAGDCTDAVQYIAARYPVRFRKPDGTDAADADILATALEIGADEEKTDDSDYVTEFLIWQAAFTVAADA